MPASQDETAVAQQRRPLIFHRVARRERRPATVNNAGVVTTVVTTGRSYRPFYCNPIPRRVVVAPPLGVAKGTTRRTGPNPVITLGSRAPSPLQSRLPLSTTIVPSPTSVFA